MTDDGNVRIENGVVLKEMEFNRKIGIGLAAGTGIYFERQKDE